MKSILAVKVSARDSSSQPPYEKKRCIEEKKTSSSLFVFNVVSRRVVVRHKAFTSSHGREKHPTVLLKVIHSVFGMCSTCTTCTSLIPSRT